MSGVTPPEPGPWAQAVWPPLQAGPRHQLPGLAAVQVRQGWDSISWCLIADGF